MTAPVTKFDAMAFWDALSPAEQRRLGTAALVLAYCFQADADEQFVVGFAAAHAAALAAIEDGLPALALAVPPALPDLAALGVRACRCCGCTDEVACPGGCDWVEADLCSTCAAPERTDDG